MAQPGLFPDAPVVDPRSVSPTFSTPYAKGSETSKAAAVKARDFVAEQGFTVLAWITAQGEHGATQKEAERPKASGGLGIGRPSLAARFNALERKAWITKTTRRRDGCAVYTS